MAFYMGLFYGMGGVLVVIGAMVGIDTSIELWGSPSDPTIFSLILGFGFFVPLGMGMMAWAHLRGIKKIDYWVEEHNAKVALEDAKK